MPALLSQYRTQTYTSARALPTGVWEAFEENASEANVIYPHALKALERGPSSNAEAWVVITANDSSRVEFVLSCTEGSMGSYPIFIFSTESSDTMDSDYLYSQVVRLADALLEMVCPERVYSVFAPDSIAILFANEWSNLTGIGHYAEPYYAAKLSYCTAHTLCKRPQPLHPTLKYDLRLAGPEDISGAAELCYGFAQESAPFTLTPARAVEEATKLISNGQLWVHRISEPGRPSEVASIVAVTRESDEVSAITKVFTSPNWRRLGCAERLVRRVCKHLLMRKEKVVLFVAHDNPAAQKVYHRVGFAGLAAGTLEPTPGVSSWIEFGFDRKHVHLGHW